MSRAGKDVCLSCPASLACLTFPKAGENGADGSRRNDWKDRIRAHLHWCPRCKKNYFQLFHGDMYGDMSVGKVTVMSGEEADACRKGANEIDVDPLCSVLLDFRDKQKRSVVCWKCRHGAELK